VENYLKGMHMRPSDNRQSSLTSRDSSQAVSAFMSSVYLWMMVGIFISGITAYTISSSPDLLASMMQNKVLFYGLLIMQFVAVIALSAFVQRMSVAVASAVYVLYATMTGATFAVILQIYTTESISSAFFVTSFAFAGLSLYGYTTKRDLGPIGSFCMMGLFGIIGVMILGMFFPSMMGNSMQLTIATIGVLVFAGLTAYDTQRIKAMQLQFTTADQARKGAIYGALVLYLDFINLFLEILRLMGNRR
jgi:FtsH-binding integral membrane protein